MVAVSTMANRLFPQISCVAFAYLSADLPPDFLVLGSFRAKKVRGKSIKSVINNPLNTLEFKFGQQQLPCWFASHTFTHLNICLK